MSRITGAELSNWLQADIALLRRMRADLAEREPQGDPLTVHPPSDMLLQAIDRALEEKQAALDALRGATPQ